MKKLLAFILVGVMIMSLSSCSIVSMKGEEVILNYDTAKMEENLNEIKEDGLYVELLVTSYESGDKPETSRMAYAETKDMFYFLGDGMESYYDFSDSTKTVMFDKNDDGIWLRSEIIYEETGMTREQMEATCHLQASSIFTYLGSYEQFNGQKMKKIDTTIAGRACDEFNISIGLMGYGINYIFAVDPETGMCLKWQFGASAGMEGSASVSFTCNKFETPYSIKLPTDYVDADAESDDGEEGGENTNNSASVNNGQIMLDSTGTAYNRSHGYGVVYIEFVDSNGEDVKFEEIWEMSATEWGFSTTDSRCTLTTVTANANDNTLTIHYEGITEQDFTFGNDITDITYTPVDGKAIKTITGEVIEGFTYLR